MLNFRFNSRKFFILTECFKSAFLFQINVRAGGRVDNLQLFYGGYEGRPHGGLGGTLLRLRLYEGHRRRIHTEEKAKVVAAAWGTELIQFLVR